MKITFEIHYHTRWGENVLLSGDIDMLGAGDEEKAVVMDYRGDDRWAYTIEVPSSVESFG